MAGSFLPFRPMKQTLQLRLSQHLAMTPRLQQAIRLLQLSTVELHTEVQEALDSNLMLEVDAEGGGAEAEALPADVPGELEGDAEDTDGAAAEAEVVLAGIPGELAVDSVWADVYDSSPGGFNPPDGDFNGADPDAHRAQNESLKDHLHWQMSMTRFSDTERVVGAAIIDAVNDDGYLELTLEDIRQSLDPRCLALEGVEAVLQRIQSFDPPGVAARGLDECLALQLRRLPGDTEWRDVALAVVTGHLRTLASRDYPRLMRVFGIGKDELQGVVDLIRSLSPRPGSAVASPATEYVVPDIFVHRERGVWQVTPNLEAFPKLRINAHYASLIRRADDSADNNTLKNHLQEARWFIKSLRNRRETLLKVAACIVERQKGFLERGEEAMKPMVLADVAAAVGMHESTISRVTTRKYMHTPRGVFELKYFFSSPVYTVCGSEASATAVRAVLRKLIAAENPSRPLSDNKLAAILSEQGIRIARRTVAKYRESMAIPASTDRKAP